MPVPRRRGGGGAGIALGGALVLAQLAPADAAGAQELDLSVATEFEYDDRVIGDDGDFAAVLRPSIELRDPEGTLKWRVQYRPFYEAFAKFSEASDVSHVLHAEGTWEVTRRTSVEISNRFRDMSRASLFNEPIDEPGGPEELALEDRVETERLLNNSVEASLRHRLTAVDTLTLSARHNLRETDERDVGSDGASDSVDRSGDRTNLGLTGRYMRQISERTSLGLGLSATRSETEGRGPGESDFVNLFGSWQYRPEESLEMSLRVGPALVRSKRADRQLTAEFGPVFPSIDGEHVDATTCSTNDAGRRVLTGECDTTGVPRLVGGSAPLPPLGGFSSGASESSVSFFANGSITKTWDEWTARLRYSRRESESAQLGPSTISDVVSGSIRWEPTSDWRFTLGGSWNRRTQATDQEVAVPVVEPLSESDPSEFRPEIRALVINLQRAAPNIARAVGVATTTREGDFESTVFAANLRGSYELTRQVRVFGRIFYAEQTSDFRGRSRSTDSTRVTIGVEYDFDPIRF